MASYDLERFIEAQQNSYQIVLKELKEGRKRNHWIWFISPLIAGLGQSPTSQRYAITSIEGARAYLTDPILGSRLSQCTELVIGLEGRSAFEIFGSPDDLKFRSSMTLFKQASPENGIFQHALKIYYRDEDAETLTLLS